MTIAIDIRSGEVVGQVLGYGRECLDNPDAPEWIHGVEGEPVVRLLTATEYKSVPAASVRLEKVQ